MTISTTDPIPGPADPSERDWRDTGAEPGADRATVPPRPGTRRTIRRVRRNAAPPGPPSTDADRPQVTDPGSRGREAAPDSADGADTADGADEHGTAAPGYPAPERETTAGERSGLLRDDSGMSTVEYAIGTVAAAAFAAVLYAVISGDTILTALTDIVQRALSTTF